MRTIITLTLVLVLAATTASASADLEAQRQAIFDKLESIEANPEGLSDSERLQALIDTSFEYVMFEHPEFATYLGLPMGNDRWTDNSLEAMERRSLDPAR